MIDRLIEKAARAGLRMNPPLPWESLREIERGAGISLPIDYATFLMSVGNGGQAPCRLLPLDRWDAAHFTRASLATALSTPCIITPDAIRHGGGWIDALQIRDWGERLNRLDWDPMYGTIALAEIDLGVFYSLIVNGPHAGRVFWFGEHVAIPPVFEPEPSFSEWIEARIDTVLGGASVDFLDGRGGPRSYNPASR